MKTIFKYYFNALDGSVVRDELSFLTKEDEAFLIGHEKNIIIDGEEVFPYSYCGFALDFSSIKPEEAWNFTVVKPFSYFKEASEIDYIKYVEDSTAKKLTAKENLESAQKEEAIKLEKLKGAFIKLGIDKELLEVL